MFCVWDWGEWLAIHTYCNCAVRVCCWVHLRLPVHWAAAACCGCWLERICMLLGEPVCQPGWANELQYRASLISDHASEMNMDCKCSACVQSIKYLCMSLTCSDTHTIWACICAHVSLTLLIRWQTIPELWQKEPRILIREEKGVGVKICITWRVNDFSLIRIFRCWCSHEQCNFRPYWSNKVTQLIIEYSSAFWSGNVQLCCNSKRPLAMMLHILSFYWNDHNVMCINKCAVRQSNLASIIIRCIVCTDILIDFV